MWKSLGRFGDGVRIGVIDTGIDYRHADFGGGTFPNAKVVGGHDFAGDAYTGRSGSIPEPDADPLDCEGHGTHVAGTAAGYGVNADGTTYRGSYSSVDLDALKIGPGTAPKASLYALKVFGCEGGTNLTAQALDWALDPNGDGDFSDRLDVVNLSLGSDFGASDDPDALFVRKLVEHGVVVVAAAGNGGDFYDVAGSPGNAPEAISVANSRDSFSMLDGLEVAGKQWPGQYSQNFKDSFDLTLPVVAAFVQCGRLSGRSRSRWPGRSSGWSGTTTTPPAPAVRVPAPTTPGRPGRPGCCCRPPCRCSRPESPETRTFPRSS